MITTLTVATLLTLATPAPVHKPSTKPAPKPPAIAKSIPLPPVTMEPVEPMELVTLPFDLEASYPNGFYAGQCTAFVASKKRIPWRGNANAWDDNARAMGVTVSDVPVVGAVAQTDRGTYGHVALVIGVGDGVVLIREQNYDYRGSIRDRWAPVSEFNYIWY